MGNLKRSKWAMGQCDETKAQRRRALRVVTQDCIPASHHGEPLRVQTSGISVRAGVGGRRHRRRRRAEVRRTVPQYIPAGPIFMRIHNEMVEREQRATLQALATMFPPGVGLSFRL